MADWTSLFSGGGDSSLNTWGNAIGGAYNSGGSDYDWGSALTDTFSGGSGGGDTAAAAGGWWNTAKSWLGGSSGSGSGTNGGNIYESLLSGVGGAASAMLDEKTVKEAGKQQRTTLDFTASLKDFYEQKDKVRKRAALDTYGQFSTMDRWAPNAQAAAPVDATARPGVG